MANLTKQQISSVRSAMHEIHAELLAWDPHVLVAFSDATQKAQVIARMGQLGWCYVDDPSNETADVSIAEFSLAPASPTKPEPATWPISRFRRAKFPAPFFASIGIILALAGIVLTIAGFSTDYRMGSLAKDGIMTTGEIERIYSAGRGRRTHYISYRFVDGKGIAYCGDDAYPSQDWYNLKRGAPISVTYRADDPEQNNLTQRVLLVANRSLIEKLSFITVPWIGSGCFFLGYWVRKRRSEAKSKSKLAGQ